LVAGASLVIGALLAFWLHFSLRVNMARWVRSYPMSVGVPQGTTEPFGTGRPMFP
jgi:hypothetical protein